MREREQRAEARSIQRLLYPRSVAVVGASNDAGKIGHAVFANLLRMGFDGPLYPINPEAPHVGGVPAYPLGARRARRGRPGRGRRAGRRRRRRSSRSAPRAACAGWSCSAAASASAAPTRNAPTGEPRSASWSPRRARTACASSVRTASASSTPTCTVRLNASLAPLPPLAGRAGFFAQSGALGVAVLGEAARRGIGVSTFVSAGSRADVSGNDLLQFWETDEHTDVVLMYLESFGNPRKFARLARRLGRRKPIVAVNSGAGTVVAGLETTSVELPDDSARALFERSGVIRVDTVGDLFDVALLLTSQPLPDGSRVAVVGNSTALAVLVRNACAAEGLSLRRIEDVGVDAAPQAFEESLQTRARRRRGRRGGRGVRPAAAAGQRRGCRAGAAPGRRRRRPSRCCRPSSASRACPGARRHGGESSPAPGSVPSYASPERAVRALGRAVRYAAWRSAPAQQRAGAARHRSRRGARARRRGPRRRRRTGASSSDGRSRPVARRDGSGGLVRGAAGIGRGGASARATTRRSARWSRSASPASRSSCWAIARTRRCR